MENGCKNIIPFVCGEEENIHINQQRKELIERPVSNLLYFPEGE